MGVREGGKRLRERDRTKERKGKITLDSKMITYLGLRVLLAEYKSDTNQQKSH